jgi:hypothetical protein
VAVDNVSEARAEAGCSGCLANGEWRCAPFAGASRDKCKHFPDCCSWCRVTWCPNNRASELYASLRPGEHTISQTP